MNPNTKELYKDESMAKFFQDEDAIPVPNSLSKAAQALLGDSQRVTVTRSNSLKLYEWAEKRKQKSKKSKRRMTKASRKNNR